jgi:hypothetical protein
VGEEEKRRGRGEIGRRRRRRTTRRRRRKRRRRRRTTRRRRRKRGTLLQNPVGEHIFWGEGSTDRICFSYILQKLKQNVSVVWIPRVWSQHRMPLSRSRWLDSAFLINIPASPGDAGLGNHTLRNKGPERFQLLAPRMQAP